MEFELWEIDLSFNGGVMEERENKELSIICLDIDFNKGNILIFFLVVIYVVMFISVVLCLN